MEQKIFSLDELNRYSRQFSLKEIGLHGQTKIKKTKVLCVGAGGLASAALFYLTGAGVGTLGIIDEDKIEVSNLHRQILYTTKDININKTHAASNRLKALNHNVNIITYDENLNETNALNIIKNYDIVIDSTDNFTAKNLINNACVILKKVNVYAGIHKFTGQCSI